MTQSLFYVLSTYLSLTISRYQNIISVSLSIIWLIVYSIAIADPDRAIDFVDGVTYVSLAR